MVCTSVTITRLSSRRLNWPARSTSLILIAPPQHVVAYLDPSEFKSTWLGNKAIYRTRLAIATGGRLTVLGPAVEEFG